MCVSRDAGVAPMTGRAQVVLGGNSDTSCAWFVLAGPNKELTIAVMDYA